MSSYSSYKVSSIDWVGDIPSHWKEARIKNVCKIFGRIGFRGYTIADIVQEGEGAISLSPSNIIEHKLVSRENTYITWEKYHESPEIKIRPDDIILVKTGSTIGKVALVPSNQPEMTLNPQLVVLKEIGICPGFLYYLMTTNYFQSYFIVDTAGGSTPAISQEKINNFRIVFPLSQEEQIAIVHYLDNITTQLDKLVVKKQRLIELLHEERTAIINRAINGEGKNWEKKKLKYVAEVNPANKHFSFNKDSEDEVVFLPMEKVLENGEINQDSRKKICDVSTGFTYFERGDIIVAKITPCFENGKGALLENLATDFGFGSTEFHTIRTSDKITKEFLYYQTKSDRFMQTGEAFMTGSAGQKRVPSSFVQDFVVSYPSTEEQIEIVRSIKVDSQRIDKTIAKAEQEIELLHEYRTALISEVVTGKVNIFSKRNQNEGAAITRSSY